jgi:hypothetical protein
MGDRAVEIYKKAGAVRANDPQRIVDVVEKIGYGAAA